MMSSTSISAIASWRGRPERADEIAERLLQTTTFTGALASVPLWREGRRGRRGRPMAPTSETLQQLVERGLYRDDDGVHVDDSGYTVRLRSAGGNGTTDLRLTAGSESDGGAAPVNRLVLHLEKEPGSVWSEADLDGLVAFLVET